MKHIDPWHEEARLRFLRKQGIDVTVDDLRCPRRRSEIAAHFTRRRLQAVKPVARICRDPEIA
ncbi:hypothetical protein HY375_03160 [Candidatus Berkelbacteria bacterium]|nr:hypothetical protein [Candidatus Berkelbacteria bacterium]